MLLSIIVVAYNNADYIEQAIASCMPPDENDCEVIVVHNRSTDHTGEILGRLAETLDVPFRVISNSENVGPGEARNIGMAHASGDYFIFLDGDDWYEPGAIGLIMDRLHRSRPDVLMFNHQRVMADGKKFPNIPNRYVNLRLEPVDLTAPEIRKGAIRNLHISWNKAYGRDFLCRHGLTFPALVYHEDLLWSIKAIVCANTCHFIPDVIYNYRQHPKSSIHTASAGHFNVINECRRLKEFLLENPDYQHWYGVEIYGYARAALLGVINTRFRIPEVMEEKYIQEMALLLKEFRHMLGMRKPDFLLYAAMTGKPGIYFCAASFNGRANRFGRTLFDLKKKFTNCFSRWRRDN